MIQKSTLFFVMLTTASLLGILIAFEELSVSVPNVSGVTVGSSIGVYWNRAATNSCTSINWGEIRRGTSKRIIVYVKNQGNESLYYLPQPLTEQWNPVNAEQYMSLVWNYSGNRMSPGSIMRVSLTLSVYRWAQGVTAFSFNIVILGNSRIWGDVNLDGHVDIRDLAIVAKAYGSSPGSPNWNPLADINQDGTVDVRDISIAAKNYGKY